MPAYYFHVHDNENFMRDELGIELPEMPRQDLQNILTAVLREESADQVLATGAFQVEDAGGDVRAIGAYRSD